MKIKTFLSGCVLGLGALSLGSPLALANSPVNSQTTKTQRDSVEQLLKSMTLQQKIGQLQQSHIEVSKVADIPDAVKQSIRSGKVGSFLNANSLEVANELQRIAVEESPNGVPLLLARDVIHGYKTIFPIPLGQAASWNPDAVREGARIAAIEASADGIRWTFAPMIDLSRDARWGRIAESFGEDPYLMSLMGVASIEGYQGDDLSAPTSIAATAKHFIGYGAAEAGRDYNTTYIPEPLLHNQYLPPFDAAVKAGVASIMSAFNDLNGIPASINRHTMDTILRKELGFDGVLVSDWDSVVEAVVHGAAANPKEAAYLAAKASLDMEMVSTSFQDNLAALVAEGKISEAEIDAKVRRILALKKQLGLFEQPYTEPSRQSVKNSAEFREVAKQVAAETLVLLKNDGAVLPLKKGQKVALIGPLADAAHDQMGTWVLDGEKKNSVTVLEAFQSEQGKLRYVRALEHSRSHGTDDFKAAIKAAKKSDVIVFVGGEEAALSGEAHSRASIRLPGAQEKLIEALKDTGKPLVLVLMAGRSIELNDIIDSVDALVMTWHAGSLAGPAISDLLYGRTEPVGRLPITWPKVTGQLPMYYNEKNTGRPPLSRPFIFMEDYPIEANQHSLGHAATHMDIGFKPQFPFGFGLSYSEVSYGKTSSAKTTYARNNDYTFSAEVANTGKRPVTEVVQLYIQDVVGTVTRPVKELKAFKRVALQPGEKQTVTFTLKAEDLMFYNAKTEHVFEPGAFRAWIAPHADSGEPVAFEIR
ncbi:MAG TPA: beta-glucosidase BglX [Marinagarivorans sp.]